MHLYLLFDWPKYRETFLHCLACSYDFLLFSYNYDRAHSILIHSNKYHIKRTLKCKNLFGGPLIALSADYYRTFDNIQVFWDIFRDDWLNLFFKRTHGNINKELLISGTFLGVSEDLSIRKSCLDYICIWFQSLGDSWGTWCGFFEVRVHIVGMFFLVVASNSGKFNNRNHH